MANSKTDRIVSYMRRHTGITQMDAYDLCKATRLAAIIHALREDKGMDIRVVYYPMEHGGRYAEYRMTKECKERLKKEDEDRKKNHD